jgi:hypothetical protein
MLALGLIGCDNNPTSTDDGPTLETHTVEDLPGDPTVNTGGGRPSGTGRYALFDLNEGEVVLHSSNTDRADSSSTEWDVGFRGTSLIVNGGASGPGEAAAYVAEVPFQEVTAVETDQLAADETEQLAIPSGSGNGWYNYSGPPNHVISPIPGRTLVVRTANGESYAKIRVMSYYEGMPEDPASSDAESRYYTFEYVLSDEPSFE